MNYATDTSEKGLEDIIVEDLVEKNGYVQGSNDDYRADLALDVAKLMGFLKATQSALVDKLCLEKDERQREKFLSRLDAQLASRGVIDVLRKGFKCYPTNETVYVYKALPSEQNATAKADYAQNVFSVTRQLRHLGQAKGDAVDLCVFVNGLPVLTCELKNNLTNQNWRDAEKQYKKDRDPKTCALFRFKRCMAHFAIDDKEVRFQTELAGHKTRDFLPFNKGFKDGAGNPPNPNGLATDYFWRETLAKGELSLILERYAQVVEEQNKRTRKTVVKQIFPRFHQLKCVKRLLKAVRDDGLGHSYLVQHSPGSGKSNTIAWLVHQLSAAQDVQGKNVFDSVVVVTDRVNLDKQIKDTIKQFESINDKVAWAMHSDDLKEALKNGKRIIVTTIHKFGVIHDAMGSSLKGKSFAIVIDEAHSSQGGDLSAKMGDTFSGVEFDPEEDAEDKLIKIMEARQRLKNACYFAFTATPKKRTLEMFGRAKSEGGVKRFEPYDVYTMRQATEEKFILNVIENYVSYSSFYHIAKAIEGNPKFDKERAIQKIGAYVQSEKPTIERKASVIVEHFHSQVAHLQGKEARAMVVCCDIRRALDYHAAISKLLAERHSPYKAMIAFSGEKEVNGQIVTEEKINRFASSKIEDTFASDPYRILVVANKFQTGYDEPLLSAMYVDKKLSDVKAVQTLSRLNRANPPLKDKVFVLDFADNADAIKEAFAAYYRETILEGETDPNKLFDLQSALMGHDVYSQEDVESFVEGFLNREPRPRLDAILDPCAMRYRLLKEEAQIAFKGAAKHFVRLYGFLSTLLPCGNPDWERLSIFLRFLVTKLPSPDEPDLAKGVLDTIDLDSFRLVEHDAISLLEDRGEGVLEPESAGNAHGAKEPEVEALDLIVAQFNEIAAASGIEWSSRDLILKTACETLPEYVAKQPPFRNAYLNAGDSALQTECEKLTAEYLVSNIEPLIDVYKPWDENTGFKHWFELTVLDCAKAIAKKMYADNGVREQQRVNA